MTTKYADAGISQRTEVYAERQMLKHAMPVMVLEKLGKPYRMPKNKSDTIKWRRPNVFTASDTPLQEGVTPSVRSFSYTDVSATLNQYGDLTAITDKIADTHEDPVLNDMSTQHGENIGRTIEKLNYGVVKAGTNVFYSDGSARTSVNSAISLNKQRAVVRFLKAQKGMKFTQILSGSPNFKTAPIEASFIAVAHTDVEADIRNMAGFIPCAEYGSRNMICPEEIGAVEDVRYVLSPDLDPFEDAGDTTSTMISTSGTSADVYPVLYFAKEAWGHVALRGEGAVSPSIIPVDQKTKDDPLGQRGYVGWKTYHAAAILNDAWMCRLEVGATDL